MSQEIRKFVRYRPDGLLVNSPEGFFDIYHSGAKFKKSYSYMIHGATNLIGIQDKTLYANMKKIFQHGFSDTANREHEPKVIQEVKTFIEKMAENEDSGPITDGWTNPKNMSLWCNWLTTDVVSKVVFTTSWHLMTSAANRGVTETFKTIVRIAGILHFWPHINGHEYTVLLFLPRLAWSTRALKKYSMAVIASSKAAREQNPSIKDVFGFFTSYRDPETGELALKTLDVIRNTSNFIVAGSFLLDLSFSCSS